MKRKSAIFLLPACMAIHGISSANSGPGCGLGQQVFAGQSGLAAHVMAATTNGSSSNQLFGLSFDSLGCDGETVITAAFQRDVYVASNFDNLARDAAKGGGQHLQSLAALMQMEEGDAQQFYQLAQTEYDLLFGTPTSDHSQWLVKLDNTLSGVPTLSKYVTVADKS